ncbi:MAG: hypothetical protein ACLFT3_13830 [Cyclobacteriaceae bacterium]
MRPFLLILIITCLLAACSEFDSTKIIEPTTYQIETVSLSMPSGMFPTNVAAQKVDENEKYTLVGATFKQGQNEIIGIWMFNEENPEDVKSINETAQNYSPFPAQDQLSVTTEARNLSAFLKR